MYTIEFYTTKDGKKPAKESSNITRVFYFFYVGKKAILTNGFVKKSQKTPKRELALAKKYKADYERRHPHE